MDEYLNDPPKIALSDLEKNRAEFKPMTGFDKLCAVLAIPIGIVFMVLEGVLKGLTESFRLSDMV